LINGITVLRQALVVKRTRMMLDPEVLQARIALRDAELRTLAAWTAVQMSRTHMPPHQLLEYVSKKKTGA
jgi:hypothetical protein